MAVLPLVMAPDPIFRKKAEKVGKVDDKIRKIMDDMMETLHHEHGIGMAANMVGILKRIVVIDLKDENGDQRKFFMADPEVSEASKEKQTFLEASLCYPGISADVARPKSVTVHYLDYEGMERKLEATGFLATCLQHEIDYLNGKVFLDYLSPVKKDSLMRKMKKYVKHGGHACGTGCEH